MGLGSSGDIPAHYPTRVPRCLSRRYDRSVTPDSTEPPVSMRYVRWVAPTVLTKGMPTLFTEVRSDGYVDREIGLDPTGRVIHRKPSGLYPRGDYGLFDSPPLRLSEDLARGFAVSIDQAEFERIWAREDVIPTKRSWRDRIRWPGSG
jgi:hypothetical protein